MFPLFHGDAKSHTSSQRYDRVYFPHPRCIMAPRFDMTLLVGRIFFCIITTTGCDGLRRVVNGRCCPYLFLLGAVSASQGKNNVKCHRYLKDSTRRILGKGLVVGALVLQQNKLLMLMYKINMWIIRLYRHTRMGYRLAPAWTGFPYTLSAHIISAPRALLTGFEQNKNGAQPRRRYVRKKHNSTQVQTR